MSFACAHHEASSMGHASTSPTTRHGTQGYLLYKQILAFLKMNFGASLTCSKFGAYIRTHILLIVKLVIALTMSEL